jgi:hypothetical protein
MMHFDITSWTDFARGVASDADRAAMDSHLRSGCRRCADALDLVRRIVASTGADARSAPPDDVVRRVKLLSALQSPRRSGLSLLVARLVHDSLRDPLPVGLRASDRISRHVVYEAGDFAVDLQVEQEPGAEIVRLAGQVTNRLAPDGLLTEAPVVLIGRGEVVAGAMYNRFGEFEIEYPPAAGFRLSIALAGDGARIDIPLGSGLGARKPPARRKKM